LFTFPVTFWGGVIPTALWLDANDPNGNGIPPSPTETIATIVDKSGNGYTFDAVGGFGGTFNANYLGLPVGSLLVNGNDSESYNPIADYVYPSQFTLFLAAEKATDASIEGGYNIISGADIGGFDIISGNIGDYEYITISNSDDTSFAGLGTTSNINILALVVNDLVNITGYLNNAEVFSFTPGESASGGILFNLFNYADTVYYSGNFGELRIYTGILNSTQINTINNELIAKWIPAFPSPILWLDGSDPNGNGIFPTNGDPVNTIVDKSSNGNNFDYTGNPGIYESNYLDLLVGSLAVDGNNSESYLPSSTFTYPSQFTLFAAFSPTTYVDVGGSAVLSSYAATTSNPYIGSNTLASLNGPYFYANFGGDFTDLINFVATSSSAVNITTLTSDDLNSNNIVGYFNNNQVFNFNGSAPLVGSALSELFNDGNGDYYSGNFGELRIYPGILTSEQINTINVDLMSKWGVAQFHYDSFNPLNEGIGVYPSDGPVSSFSDISGNGFDLGTPGGVGTLPNFVANAGSFGVPGMAFDGIGTYFQTAGFPLANYSNACTTYIVSSCSVVQNSSLLSQYPDDGSNRFNIHDPWSDENVYYDFGNIGSSGRIFTDWGGSVDTIEVWAFSTDPVVNTMTIYKNGAIFYSQNQSDSISLSSVFLNMGVTGDITAFYSGFIFEVIGQNFADTAENIINVSNYLMTKWILPA